jgi:hypothetical protein
MARHIWCGNLTRISCLLVSNKLQSSHNRMNSFFFSCVTLSDTNEKRCCRRTKTYDGCYKRWSVGSSAFPTSVCILLNWNVRKKQQRSTVKSWNNQIIVMTFSSNTCRADQWGTWTTFNREKLVESRRDISFLPVHDSFIRSFWNSFIMKLSCWTNCFPLKTRKFHHVSWRCTNFWIWCYVDWNRSHQRQIGTGKSTNSHDMLNQLKVGFSHYKLFEGNRSHSTLLNTQSLIQQKKINLFVQSNLEK